MVSRGGGYFLLVVSACAQAEKSHANGEHRDCFNHNWFVSPPSGAGCDMWFRSTGEHNATFFPCWFALNSGEHCPLDVQTSRSL